MSQENEYDSEDDDIPELDSVSSSEYVMDEKLEVEEEIGGGGKKETKIIVQGERGSNRMRTLKETIEVLDLDGTGNKPQPDWAKNIDLQQYNGLAVVTIPGSALTRTTDYASRWLKFADKRSSALKAYLLSPFLYGHAHQSDRWLDWCGYGKLLKQSSTNYNTQALSNVELVVIEAFEVAVNECLTMLEEDTNMKSKMEDLYNQAEKILNFYQMLRIVDETEWLRLLVKRIIPNADDKDKEELQPNGFNTVAFCTVIHVYEYMYKRNDQPDFLEEFEEQCINDEKDSESMKLKGNHLFQSGKFAEAIACYSEAIVIFPFNAFLYSNRAACYLRTKDFVAALSDGYRAIVLRRDWYKGYSRYIEAMAHTNSKKAESLCKELTTSKFTGATDGDQLRAALQKPKEAAAAASATKAPSAAKKSTSAGNVSTSVSVSSTKGSNKKSEPQSGAPRSKKMAEIIPKRNEKRETAKEAYRKLAAKECPATRDAVSIKRLTGDVDVVKVTNTEETSDDTTRTIVTTTKIISISTAPSYSIEEVVENIAPKLHVANEKKTQSSKQIKQTVHEETTPAAKPTPTATNTKTSSSNNNSINSSNSNSSNSSSSIGSNSTAAVKEKDKSTNKDKEKLRKDSESKLSKSDHKLKKNVMFNLQHASKSLIEKNYRNAIKLYETALNEIEKSKTQWHSIMNTSEHNKLMVTIHYCLGLGVWHQHREDHIVIAMSHFRTITTRYSSVIFVPAYYHLGMANAALHHYTEALKDVHNGLNHVMRGRSISVLCYPGLDEIIEESNPHIIENKLRQLKHRCLPRTIVEAHCRYRNCLQHHISTDIARDDSEFKGYISILCTERCVITYHSLCWRKLREENIDLQSSDKDHLGEACITDGCNGVIKAIKHYEATGRPKIIAQSDPPLEAPIKKEARPPKINRTKPSSSKKLARITQRRQEKLTEWRLKKEREEMATQSSYDGSITTQASVESAVETQDTAAMPNNEEEAGTPGDVRKGGFEVRISKEPHQDDTEAKLKNKAKKRKMKQRDKEVLLTGFISEHTGISGNDEIDESGNVQKPNAWNEEAPFSIPPHLRDQHSTFEGLQASGGGAKLSGADTPLGDLTIHSAEADNLLSYFVEIMDKHGPMEISDERLVGQLAILPENSQVLIQSFGGLEKFLLSSTAFVKHEGLICLAEYAAVVAASMDSSNTGDVPKPSLNSDSLKQHDIVKGTQELGAYELKQKGYSKINKDPLLGGGKSSSVINGVAHGRSLYASNNYNMGGVGVKKNSAMPHPTSRQGYHTPAPPPGLNSPLGKSPYSNKSMHMHSNNSNCSNSSHLLEGAGRKTSNNAKHHNSKESLSGINSTLDPIDNTLAFSNAKKLMGLTSSTSTEHSQEGPNGEDDELIGNLFDYNAFGTGSSSNHLSPPSSEGFFPNAYPQESIDSANLSDITAPPMDTTVTSKPPKKFSSSKFESAIAASNAMDYTEDMKPLPSGVNMKVATTSGYNKNTSTVSSGVNISYGNGRHHMEPVYLPPPPPIVPQPLVVDKKDACVETDIVYVYLENYKEKYEDGVKSQSEVVKRLQESEDRRVQMSKTHAVEMDLAVRRATENAKLECQQEIENCKEQVREEARKISAERKEHQETIKSFRTEIKSLNEKSEKLKKDLQAKTIESQSNFIRYQADMESAHKEKKKAEDRLKVAMDAQQQSLQRAMDAEIQMLTMMREFTVKEVDRRIMECDSICARLPSGSDVQKEWLTYKENMKATVEQYKTSVDSHIEEIKQGKTLALLGPLKITPPQPPQLPFPVGPPSNLQAPPPQAPAAMYQMIPQQQMPQGQNIRPQMQQPPQATMAAAAAMQTGYQIRPSYHMTQQGMAAVAPPPQQWGNIMEQQVAQPMMQQQEMGDGKTFAPQQFQQQVPNGMMVGGAAASQQNTMDSAPKQQSSFERVVERLSVEYPNYTRDEFKVVLKQVREQQGRLTNRSIDFIAQQMREVINAKEMGAAGNQFSTQPTTQQQQQTSATATTVASSEGPTPSSNVGKTPPPKKQPPEKVTVRTLPKKQGPRYLVPPQITPPKKPNLNPAYFPVYEDDNECIICQEDMRDNNSLKLQCGHRFHKACINSWFKEQSTCPTCRRHALLPEEYPVLGQ